MDPNFIQKYFDLTPIVEAAREEDDSPPEEYDANVRETQRQCRELADAINCELDECFGNADVVCDSAAWPNVSGVIAMAYVLEPEKPGAALHIYFVRMSNWVGDITFYIEPGDIMTIGSVNRSRVQLSIEKIPDQPVKVV